MGFCLTLCIFVCQVHGSFKVRIEQGVTYLHLIYTTIHSLLLAVPAYLLGPLLNVWVLSRSVGLTGCRRADFYFSYLLPCAQGARNEFTMRGWLLHECMHGVHLTWKPKLFYGLLSHKHIIATKPPFFLFHSIYYPVEALTKSFSNEIFTFTFHL